MNICLLIDHNDDCLVGKDCELGHLWFYNIGISLKNERLIKMIKTNDGETLWLMDIISVFHQSSW